METQAKHRWYCNTKKDAIQGLVYDEQTGANIAVVYDPKNTPLIAAAPELLEAAKIVADYLEKALTPQSIHWPMYNLLTGAISKAEGR